MAGAAWAARMGQGTKARAILARRRHLAAWVGAFALVFFAFSLWFTWWSPKQAYFFTPVRFWEFAVGGLVALASGWLAAHVRGLMAVFVAIAGWLALFVTTVLLTPTSPFPGWWALVPVLGTAAVVAAGCAGHVPVLHVVTDFPVFRFLGDISYSLYLWHWPLIILAPFALRHTPVWQDKLGILALTVALAWATKRWVEDPGQATPWPDAKVLLAMLVALGIALTGSAAAIGHARSSQSAMDQAEQVFLTGTCAGPRALLDPQCREHVGDPLFKEYLSDSSKYYTHPEGCVILSEESGDGLPRILECDHSAGNAGADLVYVLGDSHAQQWQHVVNQIATKHGWRLRLLYKGGCPMAPVPSASGDTHQDAACTRMHSAVEKHLVGARPDRLLHTTFAVRWKVDDGSGRPQVEQYEEGLHRWWEQWRSWGAHVDVIADSPLNGAVRPVECPVVHANDPAACAVERARALPSAPLDAAVASWEGSGVRLLDMTDAFCDATVCHAAAGGVQVYYDYDHVQKQYTDQLVGLFEERLLGSTD
ncbi:acyltransferase [Schaalia sp. 19OD2882]|uniref:acyltransferase family protein n=1 Tax=Schaalia sp. 19OD2882 TaxID=2794089 RepID=UPI001C1ED3F6|nr:acyltransferase family protein [Schaalia sp. 19OD2882]QWW20275.1 acyltransferase [Schaalia sp. 19OD2882]